MNLFRRIFCLSTLLMVSLRAEIRVESIPEAGMQPQVIVSDQGLIHLKEEPGACDIRNTSRPLLPTQNQNQNRY